VNFFLKVRIDVIYLKMRSNLVAKKKTESYGLQIVLSNKLSRTQTTDKPAKDRFVLHLFAADTCSRDDITALGGSSVQESGTKGFTGGISFF